MELTMSVQEFLGSLASKGTKQLTRSSVLRAHSRNRLFYHLVYIL